MASQLKCTISLILSSTLLCCLLGEAESAITDKAEIEALRTIVQLGMTNWNLSVDPCTDNTGMPTNNSAFQGLECDDCSDLDNTVCHVNNITLRSLNLSGVLSPELGNLSRLQQLDLTDNFLTGSLPSQLGSLTSLKYLYLSRNFFSGSIPKELGNLMNLEKLHLSSNHFSGEIPSTFINLGNLTELWASSNNFTGQIPSIIGNLANLTKLILQGTSLKGPIPSNISNLINLKDLRISDIAQGGDFLENILSLTNLKILVLRNNDITGEIPKTIGTGKILSQLEILDLSFNKLTGEIPTSLNSLASLQFLFLGNNNLTGILPTWLSNAIPTIDLSYNQFSGDIPMELTTSDSKVNIIWNSLRTKNDRDPTFCLQRKFPCEKKSQNYGFAINCGGPNLKSFGNKFDKDEDDLVAHSFFLGQKAKWLVTSTGHYMDSDIYIARRTATFSISPQNNSIASSHALNPELYMTARISPTSLRYYGLDLHNGLYTVELHFAEIQYLGTPASKKERIFDVYIQGDRKLKDFNIKEVAEDQNLAVVMNYTINVTENFLEIHFFWAGKGTCCEPQDMYGPLVSAIKVSPQFKVPKNNKTVVIIVVVVIILGLLLILSIVLIKKRKRVANILSCLSDDKELKTLGSNSFSLRMMEIATKGFDPKNKIGEGGFGAVYKGIMPDGRKVAIKKLSAYSKQGNQEFLNEVGLISAAQHPDLVKLYGCCVEGDELLLVYEYMENGNLAQALFDRDESRIKLDWPTRYKICIGIARGLAYLHEESLLKIIHRDIKSTNILLDKDFSNKVADFGLARLFDEENTHVTTKVAGTIGYLAPEYALSGQLTDKADVYSFGVLILEIVSGRCHTDSSLEEERAYLLEWAWHLYEEKKILQLVDDNLLLSGYNEEEVERTINVGLLCTHENPGRRPSMSTIVEMLEGTMETPASHSRPGYLNHWQVWQLASGVPFNQAESSKSNTSTHKEPLIESSYSHKQTLTSE